MKLNPNGLDFRADGGNRLTAVQVSARFDGEQDRVEGDWTALFRCLVSRFSHVYDQLTATQ